MQYPHALYVKHIPESQQDPVTGEWTEAAHEWRFFFSCREEPSSGGSVVNSPDGRSVVYVSDVYLPRSAGRLQEGTEVAVRESKTEGSAVRVSGRVLRYSVNQLNCRLWL